eukprot:gene11200-18818_t
MMAHIAFSGLLAIACMWSSTQAAPIPAQCSSPSTGMMEYTLKATVDTVHWGYFWQENIPKLVVNSGDMVEVEMLSHQSGDYYDGMIKGDKAMEKIFAWDNTSARINVRGASGFGDGAHILTGPIYVCGAEEGDIIQIDILDLQPRVNPNTGKTFGSNGAATWGYQYRAGGVDGKPNKEMTTIYELVKGASGKIKEGVQQQNYTFRGLYTPCVNGTQQFVGYKYPGLITQLPTGTENYGIKGKWKVPVNMHIGNIGLTPKYPVPVTSTAPFDSGGNLDNRRLGAGSTLYLRAEVAGGLLAMGDTHMAQGDSEFDGTAIETSINGKFKITLHKAGTGPKKVHNLTFPLIENAENYIVQGLAYNNYLNHPDLQPNPQQLVLQKGSSLDKAMNNTYLKAREWLMNAKNLTEDEVNTFITVMCDFQVTQVVDGNWGVHLVIPKFAFQKNTKPHDMMPEVVCGTSTLQK